MEDISIVESDIPKKSGFHLKDHDVRFNHKKQAIVDTRNSRVMGYEFFSEPVVDNEPVNIMKLIDSISDSNELENLDRLIIESLLKNYVKRQKNVKRFINISSVNVLEKLDPAMFYRNEGIVVEIHSKLMEENIQTVKNKIDELKFYKIEICIDDYYPDKNPIENIELVNPQYVKLLNRYTSDMFLNPNKDLDVFELFDRLKKNNTEIIVGHVENYETMKFAEKMGAMGIQGYFIEKPII